MFIGSSPVLEHEAATHQEVCMQPQSVNTASVSHPCRINVVYHMVYIWYNMVDAEVVLVAAGNNKKPAAAN